VSCVLGDWKTSRNWKDKREHQRSVAELQGGFRDWNEATEAYLESSAATDADGQVVADALEKSFVAKLGAVATDLIGKKLLGLPHASARYTKVE
jgi:hypothetical protein